MNYYEFETSNSQRLTGYVIGGDTTGTVYNDDELKSTSTAVKKTTFNPGYKPDGHLFDVLDRRVDFPKTKIGKRAI